MLGPMFGDWGALLMQFLITAVVILGLVGLVYWLVRRYSAAGLGRIGRGRVPRLAIIDAMSVDGRRRLVLVRRDNVEHLILIGGPSDLVVEQAIQRPRQAKPAAAAGEAEPALPQPPPLPKDVRSPAAIPSATVSPSRPQPSGSPNGAHAESGNSERVFSFRRSPPPQPAIPPTAAPRSGESPSPAPSAARFVDLQRPTRIEPATGASQEPEQDSEPLFPELPTADLPPLADEVPAPPPAANGGDRAAHPASVDPRPAAEAPRSLYAKPDPAGASGGGNLAELENEMARLLGEITQKRTS
jgi:flagellar biogenesis protein FliO